MKSIVLTFFLLFSTAGFSDLCVKIKTSENFFEEMSRYDEEDAKLNAEFYVNLDYHFEGRNYHERLPVTKESSLSSACLLIKDPIFKRRSSYDLGVVRATVDILPSIKLAEESKTNPHATMNRYRMFSCAPPVMALKGIKSLTVDLTFDPKSGDYDTRIRCVLRAKK